MRLNGRRESSNVDDRRGRSGLGGKIAGGGIVGVIIAAVIAWISALLNLARWRNVAGWRPGRGICAYAGR